MLDPTFHITTPRLYLSYLDPSNDAHLSYVIRLKNSPEMLAMVAQTGPKIPPQPQTIEEARLAQLASAARLEKTGTGRFIISLRKDTAVPYTAQTEHEYIGTVSMQLNRFPEIACPKIPDLGFALLAQYYGQGYAMEACNALMQHFKETKGVEQFAGFTHPENINSQKLFKRLGFESRGTRDVAGVVGRDGSGTRVAVWVKGVDSNLPLEELGISSGTTESHAEG